jgi:hypothetical protein
MAYDGAKKRSRNFQIRLALDAYDFSVGFARAASAAANIKS